MSCVKTRLKGKKKYQGDKNHEYIKEKCIHIFFIVLIFLPLSRDLTRDIYCVCIYIFLGRSVFVYCNDNTVLNIDTRVRIILLILIHCS